MKRKIGMLTGLSTNEQEWWLFNDHETFETQELSLEVLIESGLLFNMPLTVLIENDVKLVDLKKLLDELTESNAKSSSSSSASAISSFEPLAYSNNIVNKNSKLTPMNGATNVSKLYFLVTQKTPGIYIKIFKKNLKVKEITNGTKKNLFYSLTHFAEVLWSFKIKKNYHKKNH